MPILLGRLGLGYGVDNQGQECGSRTGLNGGVPISGFVQLYGVHDN